MTDFDYDGRCKRAATAQGLDPLTKAVAARKDELDAHGVTYSVEQTGGFVMVATFYLGEVEAITCTNEGAWMAIAQPMEDWTTGEWDEERITDLSAVANAPEPIIDLVLVRAVAIEMEGS
jgi:hypothetical protein